MPNYLEIFRLHELSISMRQISQSVGSGRNTVSKVLRVAQEKQLTYHELSQWEKQQVEEIFQPKKIKSNQRQPHFVLPDYEQLAKELETRSYPAAFMGRICGPMSTIESCFLSVNPIQKVFS
ncbi:MAG: hypothetical protein L0L57_09065 [Alkalibacterium sp.]|nr:hypothetical protein [Staphylococcus equorum]MDN6161790.1 hypothetical protein [Atopostipes sp.]MDN6641066.1 hypothetical protein [Tetragenococcus sp.]MDN6730302.1 hypothetical protein [Alkalibacterium sp.]MDN6749783.1 hypothetical protein [Staphylococcus equorum]